MPRPMLPERAPESALVCNCGQDLKIFVVDGTRTKMAHVRDDKIAPCLPMSKPCPCGLDFVVLLPPEYDEEMGKSLLDYWYDRKKHHKGKMPIGVAREYYELCHTWYAHTLRVGNAIPIPDPSKYIFLP